MSDDSGNSNSMAPQNLSATGKGKKLDAASLRPVPGITMTNYARWAKDFIQAQGHGEMIACRDTKFPKHDMTVKQNLRQWGAWRSFLKRLGLTKTVKFMDRVGCYMVPTEWPHQFSADADSSADFVAGMAFEDWYFQKLEKTAVSVQEDDFDQRRTFAQAMREATRKPLTTKPPWEVKPEGYWTTWTQAQRDAHDRAGWRNGDPLPSFDD